jgi:hypothetical protein
MVVGILVVPIVCAFLVGFVVTRFFAFPPRPYTAIVFFASALLACIIQLQPGSLSWQYSLHTLLLIFLSTFLLLAEVLVRGLHQHYAAAACAIAVGPAYYFFLISAVTCAAC